MSSLIRSSSVICPALRPPLTGWRMPKLAHSLNRSVFVAIPAFFGDEQHRRCILSDVESAGIWLRGEAINERLAELTETASPADHFADVFFPFDQVIYVFDPTQFALVARGLAMQETIKTVGKSASPAHKELRSEQLAKRKIPKRKR